MSTYVSLSQVLLLASSENENASVVFESSSIDETTSSADLDIQNEVEILNKLYAIKQSMCSQMSVYFFL